MKNTTYLLPIVFIGLCACSRLSDEELMKTATEALAAGDTITAIRHYEDLINDRPKSPERVNALYALGGIYQAQGAGGLKAIESYRKLVTEYPTSEKAATSLFMVGFIYHNELKDLANAKEAYEEFLQKFPDHEMAVSAKVELQYLGKDPTEIIKANPVVATGTKNVRKKSGAQ